MDFRAEVQETLRRKLRRSAAPEFQLITYQSMSSASPSALSDYSVNGQTSLVHSTSKSEACRRNATDPGTVVIPSGSSAQPALAPRCSSVQPAVEGTSVYQNSFYELHMP